MMPAPITSRSYSRSGMGNHDPRPVVMSFFNARVEGRPLADEETRLIAAAAKGGAAADEALVRRHSDVAFRTGYLVTGSATGAAGATPGAVLQGHPAPRRLRPGAPFP